MFWLYYQINEIFISPRTKHKKIQLSIFSIMSFRYMNIVSWLIFKAEELRFLCFLKYILMFNFITFQTILLLYVQICFEFFLFAKYLYMWSWIRILKEPIEKGIYLITSFQIYEIFYNMLHCYYLFILF